MATNYLDRYLSRRSCGNVTFQLASIASIFLASKIEETRPFRTSDFVTLSDGLFSAADLRLMELELLCTLKWHVNPPTVQAAVHLLLALLGTCGAHDLDLELVAQKALAFADLVRGDAAFLQYPPSMTAVAAVICALKQARAPMAVVGAWTRAVNDARLPYARAPDATAQITQCGLALIQLAGEPGLTLACDAEVQRATAFSRGPHSVSSTGSESEDDDRVISPVDARSGVWVFAVDARRGTHLIRAPRRSWPSTATTPSPRPRSPRPRAPLPASGPPFSRSPAARRSALHRRRSCSGAPRLSSARAGAPTRGELAT